MVKVRQDAWSHEDDLLLAETVLRHIREGSTQLNAFEEVGDELNRTSAACGFRWNAEVRQKYDHAIDLAKRQRKEKKRQLAQDNRPNHTFMPVIEHQDEFSTDQQPPTPIPEKEKVVVNEEPFTMGRVIDYLKHVQKDYHLSSQSKRQQAMTEKENTILKEKITELENKLTTTQKQLKSAKEDYQVFMQIMDRARKMTVFEDQGTMKTPAFRMDQNGNLRNIAENNQ